MQASETIIIKEQFLLEKLDELSWTYYIKGIFNL